MAGLAELWHELCMPTPRSYAAGTGDHALDGTRDGGKADRPAAGHQREDGQQPQDERYAQDGVPA